MVDITEDDINISLEKMLLYNRFRKEYLTYRTSHLLGKTTKFTSDMEIPRDSVLHMIDNFERNESPIPNLDYPFISNSSKRLYVQSVTSVIEMDYKYIYNSNVNRREIMHFYNSEDRIQRSLSYKQFITNRNNMMIFNYNPLTKINMREPRLKNYKKFDIIFRTILKNIFEIYKFNSDKIHFLPIFFKNKNIPRQRYLKALDKINHVTIKKTDTYDFFFIIELLRFIEKQEDSMFMDFDYDFLNKLHFILNIKDTFRIFTLPELENIIEKDGKLDTSKVTRFIQGINEFTTAHGIVEDIRKDDDKDKSPPTPSRHTTVQKPPVYRIKKKTKKQIIEDDINNAILNSKKEDLKTEKIDDFKKRSKQALLNVTYDKVTINEALKDKKEDEIYTEKNDLSKVIKNKDITDKSLLKSSIVDFDTSYINKELDKDILKVLHSFNKIGLALIDIDIVDKIEEHSKIRNVKVHYKDLDMGKSHKFNFNIPYIEENGMIKFSGVDYKLQKQQVILPIVKIAHNKVNLTSNLNKTIIERSDYKRNKFDLHIHEYIAELNRNKLIEVEFSNEDLSEYKLPLDYAILAGSYKSLKFKNINLNFESRGGDYTKSNLVIFGEMHNKESVAASRKRILDAGFKIIYHEFAHVKDDKDWAKKNNITLKKIDLPLKSKTEYEKMKDNMVAWHRERERHMLSIIESIDPNEKAAILLGNDHVMDKDSVVAKSGFDRVDANGVFYKGERSEGSDNIFIGNKGAYDIYFGYDNIIRIYDKNKIIEKYTIREFFRYHFENSKVELSKIPKEYIEIKLLDKKFPIIFLIAFRLGLTKVLKDLEVEYRTVPVNTRFILAQDEIAIRFRDQQFIFNRYPLRNSLLLAGFEKFKKILSKIYLEDMDDQNTYFKILDEMSIRKNYLKGINDYFDYFVDPITKDVLLEMNMPIDFYGLLIKATEMLTDTKHKPPASIENFRIRSYELIPAIIYNKLAREFSIQDANRYLEKRKFSIPPDAILYTILQDPTCNVFEDINPFHDLKMENSVTNSGFGGRDAQAMVARDRVYADDAIGVISESTPDSGKVGVSYVLSTNPNIKNSRGMFETQNTKKDAINMFSPGAVLTPAAHQDDSKRIGYISNQLSHQIATKNSETSRVRTGFESVLPYRVSDSYAIKARYDGEIIDIDENKQLLKVRYNKVSKANKTLSLNKSFKPDNVFYYPIDKKDKSKYNILDIIEYNKSFFTLNDIIDFIDFKEAINLEDIPYLTKYVKGKNEEDITILKLDFMEDRYITEVLEYNTIYSIAAGSYIKQSRDAISKQKGYKFKQNEILVYNTDFFQLDPFTNDISWKSGVLANVFIIDKNESYEDSAELSKNFADKLISSIAHKRIIQMDKNTSIKEIKKIGDMVEIPTPIIKITDANIEAFSEGEEQDSFLTDLNTRALKSKYIGEIVDIEILHTDDQKELHPSIQKLIKEKINRKNTSFYKDTTNQQNKNIHSPIPLYSKLYGIDFDSKETVAVVFTINENVQLGVGDKIILSSQAKATIGSVMTHSPIDEDGIEVNMLFGASSLR